MLLNSVAAAFALLGAVNAVDPVVDLSYARYQGTALPGGVSQWLGIRYAAPPLGEFRFREPQPPTYTITLQQANKQTNKDPGTNMEVLGSQWMRIVSSSTSTLLPTQPRLQISLLWYSFKMVGGPVIRMGISMGVCWWEMVVTLNYRVGLLGALAGKEVVEGGSLNNGLKDVIAVLQWVQDRAGQFGGDIHHVTLTGDSVGAIIIGYLLAAHNGTGLPGYFHAVAAESPSFSGDAQVVDLQSHYDDLVVATGCKSSNSTLDCLRSLNETYLQTKSPAFGWSPCIDNDILVAPLYELYEQRKFRQVPTIYGSTTDEGTKNVNKKVNTTTLDSTIRSSLGNITDAQLNKLKTMYPESLNNNTFSGIQLNASYPNAGNEWQRWAALYGELSIRCIASFQSDMHYAAGNTKNWHHHYDILDQKDLASGDRVYHTVELNAIWGPNNTDGNPPPQYYTTNAGAVDVMQSYWISFIRTFDPNTLRDQSLAEWTP